MNLQYIINDLQCRRFCHLLELMNGGVVSSLWCGISNFYAQSKRSIIDFDARHTENTLSNRTWLDIIPSCRTLFKQLEVINSEINNGHLVPGPLIVFKLAFVDFRSVTGLLRFPKEHANTRRISTLLHEFSSYF